MEKHVIIIALKESIKMKTGEVIQSTLQDFIKYMDMKKQIIPATQPTSNKIRIVT